MLESIRKGQRWLTILLVIFVGGVFVFFMGVGGQFGPGRPTGNAVVELGETRMQVADFMRLRARQEQTYREQLGDQFDARTTAAFLDSQTLGLLVDSVIMAHSARELGLRVSREEIQQLVKASPAFRDEAGRFDQEQFVQYATWEYGSQRNFLEMMRQDLLRQKMVALIYDQATVSPAEAEGAALYGLEQVRIAFVALDTEVPTEEDRDVDDETALAYLAANRAELQAIYDQQIDDYSEPERASARHILVQVGRETDEELVASAREKLEAARARVVAGEPFEDVAIEVSEDPGSKDQGGDLGEFARGTHAAELEDAAFSLQPGDVSDVIRSDAGFHVVKLESLSPATTRTFDDDVGPELARAEVARKRASDRATQLAQELSTMVRDGTSLEDAARSRELTLDRTPLMQRRADGFIPGLGGAPDVMTTAFGLDLDAPSSPELHTVGNRLVLVQLLERITPEEEELATAVADMQASLLAAKRNRMVQDWIDRRRDELEASGRLLINSSLVISDS